jgi:hypothetical protein
MAADKYQHAEEEYFKLRGQFDTGRLTQEQFDEKLRDLMIQDEQGRYWMLGADSGKWYFYDGTKWVQSDPYPGASAPPPPVVPVEEPPTSSPATARPSPPPSTGARRVPLTAILLVVGVVALGAGGFFVYQNRDRFFGAPPPPITPILPPTITRAPSPTAAGVVPTSVALTLPPLPTAIPPTSEPTQPPSTNAPPVTVIVVTAVVPTIEALPTLLPSATALPTELPTSAPTRAPATVTRVPPTNTSLPTCASGVCVTKIEYSPAAPKRNQDVTFTATFLNSTGGTSYYNWLILVYRQGQTKGFGESPAANISIPPGASTFTISYPVVKGPGGCEGFYARAGWKVSAFEKHEFPNTSGDPATAYFDVCP